MSDLSVESLMSLATAASLLPERRSGKRPHVSCIYRWTQTGCRGVVLESVQVGGTRCTSREALSRFFARLTDPSKSVATGDHRRTPSKRQRDSEAAADELKRLGA